MVLLLKPFGVPNRHPKTWTIRWQSDVSGDSQIFSATSFCHQTVQVFGSV